MLKSLLCGHVVEIKALISLRNHNFHWFNFKAVNPAILSLANDIKQFCDKLQLVKHSQNLCL